MTGRPTCGTCPACGASIPSSHVLIEYQREDGPAQFAECPGCEAVVHPDVSIRVRHENNV